MITHPGKSGSTITALWCRCDFFEMVVDELSPWCFDNTSAIRGGIVGLAFAEGYTLRHAGNGPISERISRAAGVYLVLRISRTMPKVSIENRSVALKLYSTNGNWRLQSRVV